MRQTKLSYPIISIAIATYNSEKTLEKTLKSIEKQTYPKQKIETLVIDGGSTDATQKIAKKYQCHIIPNPKVDFIHAKNIGFFKAKGKYLMFLDSDEVLVSADSFKKKLHAFQKNNLVKGVMPTGYQTPKNYSFINNYINEFGEPFSFFNYRSSQDARYYISILSKRYPVVSQDKDCVILDLTAVKSLPMIELMAGGGMIDLEYTRKAFPEIAKNPFLIAFFFELMTRKNKYIAITKNDKIIHYSSASLNKYYKKILARIKNNTFNTTLGKSGFSGREKYKSSASRLKKYLFIPYSFSILLPLIDAIYFSVTRKNASYLIHVPLCIYTSILIIYYQVMKLLGIKPVIRAYGN